MDQLQLALRIIAGLEDAFNHWDVFFSKPMPERDRTKLAANQWKDQVRAEVKAEACSYVANQIDASPVRDDDPSANDARV